MKLFKGIMFWLPFFAVVGGAYLFVYNDYKVFQEQKLIYVPLKKNSPVKIDEENNQIQIMYKPIIPVNKQAKATGKAVMYINSFGVASFVRKADEKNDEAANNSEENSAWTLGKIFGFKDNSSQELAFGEHLMEYKTYRPASIYPKNPILYFGSMYLPKTDLLYGNNKEEKAIARIGNYARARYAALLVDRDTGKVVLVGLTDRNYAFIRPKNSVNP